MLTSMTRIQPVLRKAGQYRSFSASSNLCAAAKVQRLGVVGAGQMVSGSTDM